MPPLAALRAFEAFADRKSVVDAGASLNVSHAAISQQLRALETYLGVALLDRQGRALELTEAGLRLAQALHLGFGAIQIAVQDITAQADTRAVHISCTPMFAAKWLMPRLSDFRNKHPEVDLVLDPSGAVVDLRPGGVDVALRFGDGAWSGLEAEMLMPAQMVVAAAPKFLQRYPVNRPADLLPLPWVEELGTCEASSWMQSHGVKGELTGPRIRLPGNLLLEAVLDGQGVAVKIRSFVQDEVQSGRLVELFWEEDALAYHIVTRPGVLRTQVRSFIAWLRCQRTV